LKKFTAVALIALSLAACTRVEPGHVGVVVNNYGSEAGVEATPRGVGTVWTGWGTNVFEYPVYTSNYTWDNDDEKHEAISFQDRNGLSVSADVNVAYRVNPALAPKVFETYRMDMDTLVGGPIRNRVRAAINNAATRMSVEEIYSTGKSRLMAEALKEVRAYFEPKGIHIDALDWAGPIRIPETIIERINQRAQNEQQAIAAQATVATKEAEARAKVAEAKGQADAEVIKAEGEAKAIRVKADAISANSKIIDYIYAEKWKGNVPSTVYCSSSTPCVAGMK